MEFVHHEPETPIGFMPESEVPPFSTQVGVDQKAESFWLRIATNYNQYRGQSREKLRGQLKSRWHRINGLVQKFVGCYKQAVNGKKSGTSEKDILAAAYSFLLRMKDEPKWMRTSTENSSKRTKNYASGAHLSSSNLPTPSSYEFNSSSPIECPMGQQAAKRKNSSYDLFWNLIEEESMDNTDEELLKSMLEKEHQSGSSSRPKKRKVIDRSREEGHNRLFNDYFSENPIYIDIQFRRRFKIHRHVFLRIVAALGNHDEYFQMSVDATGKMSLSPLQKCTYAIRMLAHGSPADSVDEYVQIGKSTSIECLERFVRGVNVVFGAEYLRKPNNADVEHLLQMRESRGFPDDTYSTTETVNGPHPNLATRLQRRASLREKQVHRQHQGYLVEHIWE
ncbi:uncharacterized protein LOC131605486 [Vicia villosa]|uniref:uncharacterized protein LOC131605486 n=1 Tax=Vicia villosa TaxID=3911 RepID=UPI00273C4923|nr:uncharacterized protein LOC131605486 [Vicia villosa]